MWWMLKGIPKGEWVVLTPEWHRGETREDETEEKWRWCQVDIMRPRHVPLQLLELFTHTITSRVATTMWVKRKTNCTLHFFPSLPPSPFPCCCTDWHYVNVGLWKKKAEISSWKVDMEKDTTTALNKRLYNPQTLIFARQWSQQQVCIWDIRSWQQFSSVFYWINGF